jgi:hypothetical protein
MYIIRIFNATFSKFVFPIDICFWWVNSVIYFWNLSPARFYFESIESWLICNMLIISKFKWNKFWFFILFLNDFFNY